MTKDYDSSKIDYGMRMNVKQKLTPRGFEESRGKWGKKGALYFVGYKKLKEQNL